MPGSPAQNFWSRVNRLWHDARRTHNTRLRATNFFLAVLPEFLGGGLRARAYRLLGADVARNVAVLGNLRMIGPQPGLYQRLSIGPGAIVGYDVVLVLDDRITIGTNASVSHFVRIYTATHPIGPASSRRLHPVVRKPVTIDDGAWVGVGSIVLPGVTIGRGAIVAPGSVVVTDVPPNTYAEGNPARAVRDLPGSDR